MMNLGKREARGTLLGFVALLGMSTLGCTWGEEKELLDERTGPGNPVGLRGSVVLHDQGLEELLFLTSDKLNSLQGQRFELGENVTNIVPSADGGKLFVLSSGEFPRVEDDDEGPRLEVFDGGTSPELSDSFELDNPMTQLSLDPEGEFVAAFGGAATVTNPNELILLELGKEDAKAQSKTIRSFGGSPLELIFTGELLVPEGGARRFMVVRTDRDITLIDLSDLDQKEVTVRLPEADNGSPYAPLQVVYDDGDVDRDDDARIAVRLAGTSDVVLLQLSESNDADTDFSVVFNIIDVGGVPTHIDFVRTDGGLRLAALVPGKALATLVNPETTLSESVELPAGFRQMTRITDDVGDTPSDGDVALLWGAANQIAFWSLGSTSSTPFRSVDATELSLTVSQVLDVPSPNQHLKVLVGQEGSGFYVLDLRERQSFPLLTDGTGFSVRPSADGLRLWVSRPGSDQFSAVFLSDLHPLPLSVDLETSGLFDIEREDGGRTLVALHTSSAWSATTMDANSPSSSKTAFFPALFWEGK